MIYGGIMILMSTLALLALHFRQEAKSWKKQAKWQYGRTTYWYECYMQGRQLPDPDFIVDENGVAQMIHIRLA